MHKLPKLTSLRLSLLSFIAFIFVVGYFLIEYTQIDLPNFSGIHKAGSVSIQTPDFVQINQPFKVSIDIDTNNQLVNAAGIYLRFNPNHIAVTDIDTSQSFCQFYPEKKIDNNQGLVSLACGSPHPGVSGINTIMVLEIQPKTSGATQLQLDPNSQLLLSNGKGTNILQEHQNISFNIQSTL